MEKRIEYFEVRSRGDLYGLDGRFATEEMALEAINFSYDRAKEAGYDNRNNEWVIVCLQCVRTFDENADFMREETVRFVAKCVEFSDEQNRFVLVY